MAEADKRPSPDALLEEALRETRGRLKIFLGAAPGVGKTYEMLVSAKAKREDGVDVVIGVVETHGRAETRALMRGFEVIPRRQIDYKGRMLEEMDLDAILARRPKLVLVDELAHTNAPGSRHPKRYLDVEELLAAGIDVYTTVNIQHVESLNDIVAQITRIRVRETVPDSIIDRADDIEVVDITPDDLIQRLKDGKVYVRETAGRALTHYFSPGNLTALRELALRGTAQRVDAQLLDPHAGQRHRRPLGRGRAGAGLHQRAPERRWPGALRQAPRGPAARPLDRARGRDGAHRPAVGDRARSARRYLATGRTARRRGVHPAGRPEDRRRHSDARAGPERHPDRHRQVVALALVRASAWLRGARSRAALRRHQRPCHRRRSGRGRPDPVQDRSHATLCAAHRPGSLTLSHCSPSLPPLAS